MRTRGWEGYNNNKYYSWLKKVHAAFFCYTFFQFVHIEISGIIHNCWCLDINCMQWMRTLYSHIFGLHLYGRKLIITINFVVTFVWKNLIALLIRNMERSIKRTNWNDRLQCILSWPSSNLQKRFDSEDVGPAHSITQPNIAATHFFYCFPTKWALVRNTNPIKTISTLFQ